jgi:hypothetical protein
VSTDYPESERRFSFDVHKIAVHRVFWVTTPRGSAGCTSGMIVIPFNGGRPKMAYGKCNFGPRHDGVVVPVQKTRASWGVRMTNLTEVLEHV